MRIRSVLGAMFCLSLAACGGEGAGKQYAKLPEACDLLDRVNVAELLQYEPTLVRGEPVTHESRSGVSYTSTCDLERPDGGVAPVQIQIFDRHPTGEAPQRDETWLTTYAEGFGATIGEDAELLTLDGKAAVLTPMGQMDSVYVLVSGGKSDIAVVARPNELERARLVALAEAIASEVE